MLLHAQDNGRQRFQTHPPCFFYPVVPVNAYVATDIPTAFRYLTKEISVVRRYFGNDNGACYICCLHITVLFAAG